MVRLAAFSMLCWPCALAQPDFGELRIAVKDSSGAAMPGAAGALDSRGFQTGRDGAVVLRGLPFGRYRLRISKDGFATSTSTVEVRSAEPVTREITLAAGAAWFAVDVVGTTPLPGADRGPGEIAAPVQAATQSEIEASGALELSDFLSRRANGVFLNEVQGNPMQPDLNYRGYTASPLLGTPQGISVYMDGVRLNQPFGDIVSWDLIPRIAIAEVALIPGSNPMFGLNTLGGALSLRTKDAAAPALQLSGGSFGRKIADFEYGGSRKALSWYGAGNLFFEDGWRRSSPSNVRQYFGKLGWQGEKTFLALSAGYANNSLTGNGLQEFRLLERDRGSVYTKPDVTANRAHSVNLQARRGLAPSVSLAGNAYFRHIRTRTVNGDLNEDSLDQAVYQPGAAERAALAAAGYAGFPAAGANATNTPFPFWRCIGNALLGDEPGEKCNGLINRGGARQWNYGAAGQATWTAGRNQLTAGAAYDGNRVAFSQLTELGYLNPDRGVTGVRAFGDGVTGGDVDGRPFDTQVGLSGRIHSGSAFATDTYGGSRWNATLSGRFNRTAIDNRDQLRPQAGAGSLTGRHEFSRLNAAAGVTFRGLYAGYAEGNRAPTSIELGCADPATPCKLPNAMAGDPPLRQVVTRTFEAGYRAGGADAKVRWSAGFFRAGNRDDILFVASEQTGYGYFRNFGRTLRQGAEADVKARAGRLAAGGGYTFLRATFESAEAVSGTGNSASNAPFRGLEGSIAIKPGDRMPLTPRHLVKAYADIQLTRRLLVDVGAVGISSSYARGNENNLHQADGRHYLGSGVSPGYAVASAGVRYQAHPRAQLFAQVNNLFNRRYSTGAQLGATGFTEGGAFLARPFAAAPNGEFPVQQSTFYAPGAPRGAWAGIRLRF